MILRTLYACSMACMALFAQEAVGQSLGLYHIPSTMPQFCGLGYGPGHHVPMICNKDCHPPRMQRRVHVCGCTNCPLPMESFHGCAGPGCHAQLDQILGTGEYGRSQIMRDEPQNLTEESILPLPESAEPPQLEMLP